MTVLLFAATLGLQAQTTASPSDQKTEEQRRKEQSAYGSTSPASSSASAQGQASSQNASTQGQLSSQNANENKDDKQQQNRSAQSASSSSTQPQQSDPRYSSNQPSDVQRQNQNASTSSTTQSGQTNTAQTGSQSNTTSTSQTNVAVNTQADAEVRTVIQQIDAQGPVIVERISTRFADVTCTEENARALVEALHNGTSVTLRGDDGQTATFTPTAHLGYGEAYVAMSLAVEALKQAGINGCATPAQWQAVLMGGQLSGGTVTTAYSTERFPGILVLHEQGGWTKVAQTTNIQLSQVVSQANTNLQLNNSSSTASTTSTSGQDNLSPTGFERGHDPRAADKNKQNEDKKDKDHRNHDSSLEQKKNPDERAPDMETPPKSETPPKY